jgi:hypothetical protein
MGRASALRSLAWGVPCSTERQRPPGAPPECRGAPPTGHARPCLVVVVVVVGAVQGVAHVACCVRVQGVASKSAEQRPPPPLLQAPAHSDASMRKRGMLREG